MKQILMRILGLTCAVVMLTAVQAQAAQDRWKDLQSLPFPENYPTKQSADRLYDEMLFHRATQVVGRSWES